MGEIIQFRAEGSLKEELKEGLMEEPTEGHMPDAQKVMAGDDLPECRQLSCFANRKGFCNALSNTDFGMRRCPFYKTMEDAIIDQLDALQRLVDRGRFDLIEKYRNTLEALGILDCEDSFFSEHSEDIDYLNRLRSLEKQMKEEADRPAAEAGQADSKDDLAAILSDEWDEDDEGDEDDEDDTGYTTKRQEGMEPVLTGGDPDECL